MINVQVKVNNIKHLEFGTKLGRDKSLCYKAAGFMPVIFWVPAFAGMTTLACLIAGELKTERSDSATLDLL
jgi:hypothetical protein